MARQRTAPRATESASAPLDEREKQQIARLLSDPMEFPMEYRSWVKNFIETVGIQLPRSSIVGLKSSTTRSAWEVADRRMPPGTLLLGPWRTAPEGTLDADGARAARTGYPRLADALGVAPEAADFALPRMPAPHGLRYVIVTGNRPGAMPESEG